LEKRVKGYLYLYVLTFITLIMLITFITGGRDEDMLIATKLKYYPRGRPKD